MPIGLGLIAKEVSKDYTLAMAKVRVVRARWAPPLTLTLTPSNPLGVRVAFELPKGVSRGSKGVSRVSLRKSPIPFL